MHLFYDPGLIKESVTFIGSQHQLNAEESWHAVKVLRLRNGDTVRITNGHGYVCEGSIVLASEKGCMIEISSSAFHQPRDYRIHLAVSPVKNMSRFEWFLEKATEVGIDEITPLICHHTEKVNINTGRLNRIITSAMKQSLGVYHPLLHEPCRFIEFIRSNPEKDKFIAWCGDDIPELFSKACQNAGDLVILIGPEGDFTLSEVDSASHMGYKPVSLGSMRLRTETAALIACMAVHVVKQRI